MRKQLVVAGLVLVMAVGASAQTQLGLMGVGGKLGLVSPEGDIGSTLGIGLQAKLGHVIPQIALDAFVDFWTKGYEESYLGYRSDASFTEIAVGALAKYYLSLPQSNIKPYAGGGLALNFGHSKVEWSVPGWGGGSESDTDVDLGIHLVGGAELPLTPNIDGFAELKYAIDGADYFAISVGAIFRLGR